MPEWVAPVACTALVALIGWFTRREVTRIDRRLDTLDAGREPAAVQFARLETRLEGVRSEVADVKAMIRSRDMGGVGRVIV